MRKRKNHPKFKKFIDFIHHSISDVHLSIIFHPDPTLPNSIYVLDETQSTLITLSGKRKLIIPKCKNAIFEVDIDNYKIQFSGKYIIGKPQKRQKKNIKGW